MTKDQSESRIARAPIVVIMGHIDHGKSTLLDYIRKSNVVDGEAGGITQHISSYEVVHKDNEGIDRKITFLDTPGHEAFSLMRSRGASVADVAILIVSAEDGVKAQTLEALASIKQSKLPFIVAINKIDKPGADVMRTKTSLIENEIYIEGMGGDIPFAEVSAKTGQGIDDLLDLLLLASDLEELSGDPSLPARGLVIESNLDAKKGISATLIITEGTLRGGQFVVAGDAIAPVRIMENFNGKKINEATLSSPVRLIGFSDVPEVGTAFVSFDNKKDAEKSAAEVTALKRAEKSGGVGKNSDEDEDITVIPLVIKADVLGTIDAIKHEIDKIDIPEHVEVRIVQEGAGAITEKDITSAAGKNHAVVVGFNVPVNSVARDLAERGGIEIETFSIIYELAEWIASAVKQRTPKVQTDTITGKVKVLKLFNKTKDKQVFGGRCEEGAVKLGDTIRVISNGEQVGQGKITNLQVIKEHVKEVSAVNEFGGEIKSEDEIQPGDYFEAVTTEMV